MFSISVVKGEQAEPGPPSTKESLSLVMAATVVGALFVLSIASLEHYRFVSRSADERVARALDIAVEHTNKVFEEIELLFSSVEGITGRRTIEALCSEQVPLHERLKKLIVDVPDLRAIWLFDRNGQTLVTSSVLPAPDLDNSDRAISWRSATRKPAPLSVGYLSRASVERLSSRSARNFTTAAAPWPE